MTDKIRILFLSANPWTTSRILVDEEAREIFERIQEGPYRDKFEIHNHVATRPLDLQRLLLLYQPQIVHFSGHGNKRHRLILGGSNGRGKTVDQQGLSDVFALYNSHVQLVLLNACFTKTQARSISEVVNYSIGTGKGIGDKVGVAFAGAFYRALGFGKCVKDAFESANAELALTKLPRSRGIELFVRNGLSEADRFPQIGTEQESLHDPDYTTVVLSSVERFEWQVTIFKTTQQTVSVRKQKSGRHAGAICSSDEITSGQVKPCQVAAAPRTPTKEILTMPINKEAKHQQVGKNSTKAQESIVSSSRKTGRKAPGTRLGTLDDWREGSAKAGKISGRHGHSVRDGR